MKRQVSAISFGLALTAFSISNVSAEERCKVILEVPAANATYTQQHVLDVGDIPAIRSAFTSCTAPILQIPSQTARGLSAPSRGRGVFLILSTATAGSRDIRYTC